MPGEIETSINETVVSVPEAKQEYKVATLGFEAINKPPFKNRIDC